ncbi:MAG: hypothetical protein IJH13_03025 [Bacilli bacterium]|nr:hypothetical protein [Bacilli bacterium]
MKKIMNLKNIGLILTIVLVSILTLNTKNVKATGTVTWSGPSSITIRETISNMTNPIVASRAYGLFVQGNDITPVTTATINFTASDTPTNYQITKSTTMNLTSLAFSKPGDYEYSIYPDWLLDNAGHFLDNYSTGSHHYNVTYRYKVIVSVRNVVDANNTPTGDFTATTILESCEYNEQTNNYENCTKISPVSGVLYADYDYETNPESFAHIEISKTVKGIGADTTKYFPITLTIYNEGAIFDDWEYPITGIDSTITYNGQSVTQPTTIGNGTPVIIYIKHGQTAIIGQATSGGSSFDLIPTKATVGYSGGGGGSYANSQLKEYRVQKLAGEQIFYGSFFTVAEDPKDYSPSISPDNENFFNVSSVSDIAGIPSIEIGGEQKKVLPIMEGGTYPIYFINTKEMSPVTGLIFTILPYVILVGIGVGGVLLFRYSKTKKSKS